MAGDFDKLDKSSGVSRYITYCDKLDRWIPWNAHKRVCVRLAEAKKGALTRVYCENFCGCWERIDDPEVRCICYGFEDYCKKLVR